jgi:hypothetical protein
LYKDGINGEVLRRIDGGDKRRENVFAGQALTMIGNDILEENMKVSNDYSLQMYLLRRGRTL